MSDATFAWHVVGDVLRDGRLVPQDMEELRHRGRIKWCESGLYASRNLYDAVMYAMAIESVRVNPMVCRVRVEDIVIEKQYKLVCRSRTILWRRPYKQVLDLVEPMLRIFDPSKRFAEHLFYREYKRQSPSCLTDFYFFLDAIDYLTFENKEQVLRDLNVFFVHHLTPRFCSDSIISSPFIK